MTQDEIIELANKYGFYFSFDGAYVLTSLDGMKTSDLVAFAKLIQEQPTSQDLVDAVLAESEP